MSKKVKLEDGRIIGQIEFSEDGISTLVKTVDEFKHMMKVPPAWAYDTDVIDLNKVDNLLIKSSVTDRQWSIDRPSFLKKKRFMDRGYGEQYFLPLQYWKESKQSSGEDIRQARMF